MKASSASHIISIASVSLLQANSKHHQHHRLLSLWQVTGKASNVSIAFFIAGHLHTSSNDADEARCGFRNTERETMLMILVGCATFRIEAGPMMPMMLAVWACYHFCSDVKRMAFWLPPSQEHSSQVSSSRQRFEFVSRRKALVIPIITTRLRTEGGSKSKRHQHSRP